METNQKWTLIDDNNPRFNRWKNNELDFIESFSKNENPNNIVNEERTDNKVNIVRSYTFYKRFLEKYFEDVFGDIPSDYIHFYNDPSPNQWKFDLLEIHLRVTLTCDDDGIVLEEKQKLKYDRKTALYIPISEGNK